MAKKMKIGLNRNSTIAIIIAAISVVFYFYGDALSPSQLSRLSAQPSTSLAVFFPRSGQPPEVALVDMYNDAKVSIDVAIYSLTHKSIVTALLNAQKRGVKIRIITDSDQAQGAAQKQAILQLFEAGVPIKINTHSGLMHLKMSVIDKAIATSGSYNYSMAASNTNDEMFIVSKDEKFVFSCQSEFERIWGDGGKFKAYRPAQ